MPATILRSPQVASIGKVNIIDVGHGSCVAVHASDSVSLIDTGPNGAILEYLLKEGVTSLDTIVISHADADHIGGLAAILAQRIPVREIIWNPDALKESEIWKDLVYEIEDRHNAGLTVASRNATQDLRVEVGSSPLALVVLAPGIALQHLGPGATDRLGRKVSSNSSSVVVRVDAGATPVALVPGDLDELGLLHIVEAGRDDLLKAYALVLPHHGGHCGTPAATQRTIETLVAAAGPAAVFVSNGREKYANPRPEVIAAVRRTAPVVKIACTQLSPTCSSEQLVQTGSTGAYARGWSDGLSCAGTMSLRVDSEFGINYEHGVHDRFVATGLTSNLC